jgi:hypothetical protein
MWKGAKQDYRPDTAWPGDIRAYDPLYEEGDIVICKKLDIHVQWRLRYTAKGFKHIVGQPGTPDNILHSGRTLVLGSHLTGPLLNILLLDQERARFPCEFAVWGTHISLASKQHNYQHLSGRFIGTCDMDLPGASDAKQRSVCRTERVKSIAQLVG